MRVDCKRAGVALALLLALGSRPARAELEAPPPAPAPGAPAYLIPALEVAGQESLLLAANVASGQSFARVSRASVAQNLSAGFVFDDDLFDTNFILHPYQGALYLLSARSAGLSFWESAPYVVGGSLLWELAMEVQPPSTNDQIVTSLGGTYLGEVLYRLSRRALGTAREPGLGRLLAGGLLAPTALVNDLFLPARQEDTLGGRLLGRLSLGTGASALGAGQLRLARPSARVGLRLSQGPPDEVDFARPFDHFELGVDAALNTLSPNLTDDDGPTWALSLRGLLAGRSIEVPGGRGLAGIYGVLDYSGPSWLRSSADGAGPGASLAWRLGGARLEATGLVAAAFGTGGAQVPLVYERTYRYGFGAYGVADARLSAGPLELDLDAHGLLVPRALGGGAELFERLGLQALWRLTGPHALQLDLAGALRRAQGFTSAPRESWLSAGLSYALRFGG